MYGNRDPCRALLCGIAIALAERAEAQRSIGGEIEEIVEIFALVSEVHIELSERLIAEFGERYNELALSSLYQGKTGTPPERSP